MVNEVKRALVLLAPGFEEVEALTPVDYLRRANIDVVTAAVDDKAAGKTVTGSHNITVLADTSLSELADQDRLLPSGWDAVVVPGGPGVAGLAASGRACSFIKAMAEAGKWVCAICAAPAAVLAPLGILAGRKFTCYPGYEEKVTGAIWSEDRVVISANPGKPGGIITSRAAGTTGEFSAAIISALVSEEEARQISARVLLK